MPNEISSTQDSEFNPLDVLSKQTNITPEAPPNPETLEDFFAIHPLEWTEDHIVSIIKGLILQSNEWHAEQTKAEKTQTRAKRVPAKKVSPKAVSNLSLDDLLDDL